VIESGPERAPVRDVSEWSRWLVGHQFGPRVWSPEFGIATFGGVHHEDTAGADLEPVAVGMRVVFTYVLRLDESEGHSAELRTRDRRPVRTALVHVGVESARRRQTCEHACLMSRRTEFVRVFYEGCLADPGDKNPYAGESLLLARSMDARVHENAGRPDRHRAGDEAIPRGVRRPGSLRQHRVSGFLGHEQGPVETGPYLRESWCAILGLNQ
jgi:hypothetical protein